MSEPHSTTLDRQIIPRRVNLYALTSRWAALTVSAWSALLGLYGVRDGYELLDGINAGILMLAVLGFADVVWHDIGGRLIWPSLRECVRHRICVWVYSVLGAGWLVKAFASAAGGVRDAMLMTGFAVCMASICGLVAVALTLEQRHNQ